MLTQDGPLRGAEDADDRARRLTLAQIRRWLRRWRVSTWWARIPVILSLGKDLGHWQDRALDGLAAREVFEPAVREWSIVELSEPFPEARVAPQARTAASMGDLMGRLTREDDLDTAWFLSEDHLPRRPDARSASLVSWDGTSAVVEHDGPCDLVVVRSFDPGWSARINGGAHERVLRVDGGCQGVRLSSSGNGQGRACGTARQGGGGGS